MFLSIFLYVYKLGFVVDKATYSIVTNRSKLVHRTFFIFEKNPRELAELY